VLDSDEGTTAEYDHKGQRLMRWGLIGTSGLVDRGGLKAFQEAENAELVAVLSRDSSRAREFGAEHGIETATADMDEFLAAPGLEAVWIASPTWRHHEQGKAVLEAGKHVLLEKPLAIDAKSAWDLVEHAKRAGVLLATGYQARYVPGHRTMKRLVDEGAIGEVSVARTYYGIHRPGPPPEWRQKRETARWGALSDVGTHQIDLLRMLLGEIAEATGYHERQQGFETDDAVAAALRLESGAVATMTFSTNVWAQFTRVELHGTEGALVAENTSPIGQGKVTLLRKEADPEDVTGERPNSWVAQLEEVTRAASGEAVPYATGEDGARAVEVMEQIVE
jgi:1,5-anhydro-D-fructose reductase (1,5-anhydro-D-mannitol-forming)